MELIMGHSFKIEAWEVCLKSMGIGEVSSFTVDKSLLFSFPMAMKQLRDIRYFSHYFISCFTLIIKEKNRFFQI